MTRATKNFDVLIVGGGMVGLTLSLALSRGGLSTLVVDAAEPARTLVPEFDGRASAIAAASAKMLVALGLWPDLEPHAQPINDILISDGRVHDRFRSGGASPFVLHFDPEDLNPPTAPLGFLIENRHVRQALLRRLDRCDHHTMRAPATVTALEWQDSVVSARLHDGDTVSAALCIGADGKGSQIRALAGLTSYGWRYPQDAIVTTVEHDRDHGGLAHEYFLPSGPFAILPLTGKRSSIVWTEKRSRASAFMELPDALFTDELASRFGDHLGRVKPFGPRFRYPLALQFAPDYARPRLALIGDAAHVIHPIAGQGLNMGLRDIAALAEVLTDAKRLGLDIGALDVLRRYQQWRRFDNVTLGVVTDTLNRLFANDFPPIRLARGLGLGAVGLSRPLRQFFMRHAMGQVGELPRLLKGELP